MRITLGIEYNGNGLHGWQKQSSDLLTIQGILENALSKIADHPIEVFCAGRTDAGVHAIGQVVHFDTAANRNLRAWIMGTNSHLPFGISVCWAKEVDETFHARYSALSRCYRYIIHNSSTRPAILAKKVTWCYESLDIDSMQIAAGHFLGENDFSSFRSSECQSKTAMRNITKLNITRHNDYVIIEIQANAFLHHMVRNIVGVLKKIGAGLEKPIWAKQVLDARDRRSAAETAPADGLYLIRVEYPEECKIPVSKDCLVLL